MPEVYGLTDRKAEKLSIESGKDATSYSDMDCKGLVLRINQTKKVWTMHYRRIADNIQKRYDIGLFPGMNVAEARSEHHRLREYVRQGGCPQSDKKQHRIKIRDKDKPETFEELALQYLEQHAKPNKRSWGEDERMINVYLKPNIGDKIASEVTIEDVEAVLSKLHRKGSRTQADRVLILTRGIYNWGIKRDARIKGGGLRYNPTVGIDKAVKRSEGVRERNLSALEIRTFWIGLPQANIRNDVKDILKIAFLTGCRSTEITGAHEREFEQDKLDIDGESIDTLIWTIPAERVKNKRDHTLPLPPLAASIFKPRLQGQAFPAKTQEGYVTAEYTVKSLQAALPSMGIRSFAVKDIRTTVGTRLARLSVPSETIARILNHRWADQNVTNVHYIQDGYLHEKYKALKTMEEHIHSLVADGNAFMD